MARDPGNNGPRSGLRPQSDADPIGQFRDSEALIRGWQGELAAMRATCAGDDAALLRIDAERRRVDEILGVIESRRAPG